MDPLKIHAMPERFRRPVLIMAFTGWNDAAEAATTAARYLAAAINAEKFAEIDPEEFYHFGLTRPYVRFKTGSETEREVVWPATEFSIAQSPDLPRDIIVGVAPEPHLKWRADTHPGIQARPAAERTPALPPGAAPAAGSPPPPARLVRGGAASPPAAPRRIPAAPNDGSA